MSPSDASLAFLRDTAAKHFVCLSYRATFPEVGPEVQQCFASCFVAEISDLWWLITAGHVITGIKQAMAQGGRVSEFSLHDKLAGNDFFAVPYSFNADEWVVLDSKEDGTDFAAAPLHVLEAMNLQAGGIKPIDAALWGSEPLDQYSHWLLAGIPDESHTVERGRRVLKLTLFPVAPTSAPASVVTKPGEHLAFAKLLRLPSVDGVVVNDLAGMSGGPIFGLKEGEAFFRYWLIGVQSGWYSASRIISFCPVRQYFEAVNEAMRVVTERVAARLAIEGAGGSSNA